MEGVGMPIKAINKLVLFGLGVVVLSGCASIPPEQLAKLATIEGAPGYPFHSVDSKLALFSSSVNVQPGEHTVEITASCYNNSCTYLTYRFNAKAGLLYRLMPNRTIAVLDRSDEYQRKLDELTPIGSDATQYVTRQEKLEYAQGVVRQAQSDRAALLERRRQNLPQVRKVGAQVCQVQGQFFYIGFVESFSDEKLQIRVAQAKMNDNRNLVPMDFQPGIILDSPLNWDLCD